ncbi:MAG: hypothetical protein ACRCV5_14295 [Afipia sp.]
MLKTDLVMLWEDGDQLCVTEPAPGQIARGLALGLSLPEIFEAIAEMDLPPHVMADITSNRPAYIVCRRSQLPPCRAYRNAWRRADALPD